MYSKELNFNTFGEIMDDFIKESHIRMMIDIPAGSTEPTITDDSFNLPVVQLYILMNALSPTIMKIWKTADDDGNPMFNPDKMENFVDDVLLMIKDDIMEGATNGSD